MTTRNRFEMEQLEHRINYTYIHHSFVTPTEYWSLLTEKKRAQVNLTKSAIDSNGFEVTHK
jgi:hypothetical protein